MSILIKNVHIYSDERNVRKDILIEENKIVSIVPAGEANASNANGFGEPDEIIDGTNRSVIPGLINCHTHAYMSLFRNCADDVPFAKWLFETIMPIEDKTTSEEAYWGNMLSFAEMLRTGTTCYVDMHLFPVSAKASHDAGIRAVISRGLVGTDRHDEAGQKRIDETFEEMAYAKSIGSNATFMLGPHAIYSCGDDYLKYINEIAIEKNMPINIHMAETRQEYKDCMEQHGLSPMRYLETTGLMDRKILIAHSVRLDEGDYELLARDNVSIATNPASNMKLANGFAPVAKMLEKGVNVCIGTDSAASNNCLNMFTEMHLLSLVHKGIAEDALTLPAKTVFEMATKNGYKAVGLDDKLGEIAEGKTADLVLMDDHAPTMLPNFKTEPALVYSASGNEVTDVIIDGKIVVRKKELLTIDEERVAFEVGRITSKYKL